jgi:hypothetical protein
VGPVEVLVEGDKNHWVPSGGPLIKSFVDKAFNPFTSEKLAKSSRGILTLWFLQEVLAGCLNNFSPKAKR